MTLAVIGDRQAVPVAGLASRCSGQPVLLAPGPGRDRGAIRLEGTYNGPIEVCVYDRPTADIYVAVSTSSGLEPLLAEHRELLAGRVLLLAPGGFGGVIRVREMFRRWGVKPPVIAEATGFPALGGGEGTITLRGVKRSLPIAGIDHAATDEVVTAVRDHLPDVVASDLITTSLSNTNHLLHPVITLLNATRICQDEPFLFYRDGLTPDPTCQLQAIDAERISLIERLGGEPVSITEWMLRFYGDQEMSGATITECLQTFPGFASGMAPSTLRHRYLLDDIPYGLAGYLAVAERLGLETPELRSVITHAERLLGQLLRAETSVVHRFLEEVGTSPAASGFGPTARPFLNGAGVPQVQCRESELRRQ